MLVAKGYSDIGWNPVEGERYLDFLRFAVFCNGNLLFLPIKTVMAQIAKYQNTGSNASCLQKTTLIRIIQNVLNYINYTVLLQKFGWLDYFI